MLTEDEQEGRTRHAGELGGEAGAEPARLVELQGKIEAGFAFVHPHTPREVNTIFTVRSRIDRSSQRLQLAA